MGYIDRLVDSDFSINFIPKMNPEALINGYKHILDTIYSPKQFYERVKIFLKEFKPQKRRRGYQIQFYYIRGFIKSMWFLGVRENGRRDYWKFFASTLLRHPRSFPLSMSLAVYGFHFRKVIEKYIDLPIEDILDLG